MVDDRDARADRVSGTVITFGVADFDDILARPTTHGISHEPVEITATG